jgi:hypothetical protein
MGRKKDKQFTVFLTDKLKSDFKKACVLKGTTMADELRRYMRNYANKVLTVKLKVHDYNLDDKLTKTK